MVPKNPLPCTRCRHVDTQHLVQGNESCGVGTTRSQCPQGSPFGTWISLCALRLGQSTLCKGGVPSTRVPKTLRDPRISNISDDGCIINDTAAPFTTLNERYLTIHSLCFSRLLYASFVRRVYCIPCCLFPEKLLLCR